MHQELSCVLWLSVVAPVQHRPINRIHGKPSWRKFARQDIVLQRPSGEVAIAMVEHFGRPEPRVAQDTQPVARD
jgi:hypothetical protein